MGVTVLNPTRYAKLLSKALPKVIGSEEEFGRIAAELEGLDFAGRPLSAEERALADLLAKLIQDYDDRRHPLPALPAHRMLRYLMEQRNLRQRDLVAVLGPSSVVSDVVNGKRSISKTQAKKLAAFFRAPVEVFL
jgi:HTH-type transcriptional regulator/antitoxin HigA